jgi:hypothetical protein
MEEEIDPKAFLASLLAAIVLKISMDAPVVLRYKPRYGRAFKKRTNHPRRSTLP